MVDVQGCEAKATPSLGLRVGLMFQRGNFVGREYFAAFQRHGIQPVFLASVGEIKPESVEWERRRTGGLWNPAPIPTELECPHYPNLRDDALWRRVVGAQVDIMVQGGVGILKSEMLAAPRLGFLNIHPGRLPGYRGNSCPEWALFHGDAIHATAHIIDQGIDTGPVVCSERYEYQPGSSYEQIRAGIYRHCGEVMVAALWQLDRAAKAGDWRSALTAQSEDGARYWPQIPAEDLTALVNRLGKAEGLA